MACLPTCDWGCGCHPRIPTSACLIHAWYYRLTGPDICALALSTDACYTSRVLAPPGLQARESRSSRVPWCVATLRGPHLRYRRPPPTFSRSRDGRVRPEGMSVTERKATRPALGGRQTSGCSTQTPTSVRTAGYTHEDPRHPSPPKTATIRLPPFPTVTPHQLPPRTAPPTPPSPAPSKPTPLHA